METPFPNKFWCSQHLIHEWLAISFFFFAFTFEKHEKWPYEANMNEQLQLFLIEKNSEDFHFFQIAKILFVFSSSS